MNKLLIFLMLSLVALIGCADDDDNPVNVTPEATDSIWSDSNGGYYAMINAASYTNHRYLNLTSREIVDITDGQANTNNNWHLGFKRYDAKTNGGVSGGLGVMGVDLADIGNPDSTNFDNVTSLPTVADSLWESDKLSLAMEGWYSYNPVTHQLAPSGKVFALFTTEGKYAKFRVDSLKNPGMPPNMGSIGIRYVLSATAGSADVSGASNYVEIDGTSGSVYFSFATGGQVAIADPRNSNAWDIHFSAYDVELNGGASGNGGTGVYLGDDLNQDFDALTIVPTGGGYFSDAMLSVFGSLNIEGTAWFNYVPPHEIVSKGHVYLLKIDANTVFKLKVDNYYRVVEGQVEPAWITMHFKEL